MDWCWMILIQSGPKPVLTGVITRQLWSSVDRTHFHHEKKWPFSSLKVDALITGLTLAPMCYITSLGTFFTFTLQPPINMAPASSVGPNDWEIQRLWDEDRSTCHPCYASAPDILVATFPKTNGCSPWFEPWITINHHTDIPILIPVHQLERFSGRGNRGCYDLMLRIRPRLWLIVVSSITSLASSLWTLSSMLRLAHNSPHSAFPWSLELLLRMLPVLTVRCQT